MRGLLSLSFLSFITLSSCAQDQSPKTADLLKLPATEIYLSLLDHSSLWSDEVGKKLSDDWSIAHAPFLIETVNFSRDSTLVDGLNRLLAEKAELKFPMLRDQQRQWLWAQTYKDDPTYADFKSDLYGRIDDRFEAYFSAKHKSTIRLDEVRWGGVIQDGIPPMRNPKMISATQAGYLGDDDVVFGIEVNGEHRAYPKRILAWHEMFTDTIQGIPLAGVY